MTRIIWHTSLQPDSVAVSFIRSAIGSNRRMRHAEFEIREADEIDSEGTVRITRQDPHRMIDPADVHDLITACLS